MGPFDVEKTTTTTTATKNGKVFDTCWTSDKATQTL